ncbi:hypothetical protein J9303_08515 [Bacillaceae bacterium Marseille-Q3522]|nr:hypothetical protein [Bacillaceae bacterium Marseille-Q3522]
MTDRELLELLLEKVNGMETQITEIKNETATKNDLERLEAAAKKDMGRLETKIERIEPKIDIISKQVVSNSEQLTELSLNQKLLIQCEQRQDKILETLAIRSLEQETDIRELKRMQS